MKKVLYFSTKKSLIEKKDDIENAISKATTDKPIWYPGRKILKYPNTSIFIYDFDDTVHKGYNYDFVIESAPGLLKRRGQNLGFNILHSITLGKNFIDNQLQARWDTFLFPKATSATVKVYNTQTGTYDSKDISDKNLPSGINQGCIHSWKTYTGLFEEFDYCEKCDRKKE